MKNPPAFQFYPNDFISERKVASMSLEERGMYITLLCYCWQDGELPDDMEEMADLCRVDGERMATAWDRRIGKCFERTETGTWINPRMRKEMQKQEEYRKSQSESGKKGAEKRWKNAENNSENGDAIATPLATPLATPMANDSSSSSIFNLHTSVEENNTPRKRGEYSDSFEAFWKAYPRKDGSKSKSFTYWKRDKLEMELETILSKLEAFKRSQQWTKDGGQFIPYPQKWLNEKRYESDVAPVAQMGVYTKDLSQR